MRERLLSHAVRRVRPNRAGSIFVALLSWTVLSAALPTEASAEPMTNSDVIALSLGGLSEENIVLLIETTQEPSFDTSVKGLLELRDAGLSERVIRAVILANAKRKKPAGDPPRRETAPAETRASRAAPAPSDGYPPERGIYYAQVTPAGTSWRKMRRAAVMGQNVDVAGSVMSGGLAKSKHKTVIRGKSAELKLRSERPRFFLRIVEGAEHPGEFCLQPLKRKGDRRQYVGMKMSSFTGSMQSCPGKSIDFAIEEVTADGFLLRPVKPLSPGDYAFGGRAGAIFDFAIERPR